MIGFSVILLLLIILTNSGNAVDCIFNKYIKSTIYKLIKSRFPSFYRGTSTYTRASTSLTATSVTDSGTITPSLLLLLMLSHDINKSSRSPLNKQQIVISTPFFQGWLLRTTDNTSNLSFIFIIGSFSNKKCKTYNQHYVYLGINTGSSSGGVTKEYHYFPNATDVCITGNTHSDTYNDCSMTWSNKKNIYFNINEDTCNGFIYNNDIHLSFNCSNRLSWLIHDNNTNTVAGPEGWLGYTSLLPCHYHIYSTGSACDYKLTNYHTNSSISSNGYSHIEGNHGVFFPTGSCFIYA